MRCAACDHENRTGASFCDGCGVALSRVCADCGTALRPSARFCDSCGREAVAGARTGSRAAIPSSLAAGRYQVRQFLGEGSKKRVYLAHDTRLERDVAVSLIKTEGLDDGTLLRVRREARAMGRLGDHPHIVTVYDIADENGQPYIVSEFMSGGSVEDLLQRMEGHRLALEQVVRIGSQLCQALACAHERAVVHRDLKPANIWLTRDGTVKLGDFGLASALDRSRLTAEGFMVGTATYMAPEQALGRLPEPRSDLYSLGVMLYEMVTGRPPFLGDDVVAVISQHINTPPVAPSWHRPEVPPALEALVLRLLAKAPEERPADATQVLQALTGVLSSAEGVAERLAPAAPNLLDRLAGGVFVGRDREMTQLRAGLENALSGRGQVLMLAGEPGIGKTRAAEELATYARLRKAQVLLGRCYEGEGAPAYWPWIQMIRSYVHDRDAATLRSEMGSGAAEIARVVSEVRERLAMTAMPPSLEPEQARFRLFDSLTAFFKNAATNQPLVLILDDLHWADTPSLLLLQFLAREMRAARLLVVGTYRDTNLGRQHPLMVSLVELAREQLSHRVMLRGIAEHDVARFIEMTTGLTPPASLLTAVYRETEGNPFFVTEVVHLLASEGRLQNQEVLGSRAVAIPQGVREVVARRLGHLSAECTRVLATASVIGREFDFAALQRLCDLSEDALLETLEQAVAARVVAESREAVGRYAFCQGLVREALYDELSPIRRTRLHLRVGQVLEELYGAHAEPHLAELAYHFCEAGDAGDLGKAADYAVRAGDRAVRQLGYEQAVRHYELAVRALERTLPVDERRRCEVLLTLGDALWSSGEPDDAKKVVLAAADAARAIAAPELLARAALGFGGSLPGFGTNPLDKVLIDLLEEALAALGDSMTPLRPMVMVRLGEATMFHRPLEWRSPLCREAIALARRCDASRVLAYVLRKAHWVLYDPDNLEERMQWTAEVIRLAEAAGDEAVVGEGRFARFGDLIEAGDVAGAKHELAMMERLAKRAPVPYILWGVNAVRTLLAILEGHFQEGEACAKEALKNGLRAQHQNGLASFATHLAMIRRDQGQPEELEVGLKGFVADYPFMPAWRCGLALGYAETGREADARREVAHYAKDDFASIPRDPWWVSCLVLLAETCVLVGDAAPAAKLYALLAPHAGRNVLAGGPQAVCLGAVDRSLGALAALLGRSVEAEAHFRSALDLNARLGAPPRVAHTQFQYAKLLLARRGPGDQEHALALLSQALESAQALGMKGLVQQAVALKLEAQGVEPKVVRTSFDAVASAAQHEHAELRAHAAPDGTVTILFTDIEGSTATIERIGDLRWMELLRAHNTVVRREIGLRQGYEVKASGDGFMVVFPSARRAVLCAIHIQRAIAAEAAQHPERETVRVRIGVHTAEAIRDVEDFFGRGVNFAARIAAEAKGAEILISSLVKELIESAGDFRFESEREVLPKGLSGVQRLFPVVWT